MPMPSFEEAALGVCTLGRFCHAKGWVPATSGNFSAALGAAPVRLAITPSGVDKGALVPADILELDASGRVLQGAGRPSAETAIHFAILRARAAGAVAHTHSLTATRLSEAHARAGALVLRGYEMLKALAGVTTHEHEECLPIVENTQDWAAAEPAVAAMLEEHAAAHAFLIRGHGLYTWGRDVAETLRHVEAIEYLLETVGRS